MQKISVSFIATSTHVILIIFLPPYKISPPPLPFSFNWLRFYFYFLVPVLCSSPQQLSPSSIQNNRKKSDITVHFQPFIFALPSTVSSFTDNWPRTENRAGFISIHNKPKWRAMVNLYFHRSEVYFALFSVLSRRVK